MLGSLALLQPYSIPYDFHFSLEEVDRVVLTEEEM